MNRNEIKLFFTLLLLLPFATKSYCQSLFSIDKIQKISNTSGNLGSILSSSQYFGHYLDNLGDLDQDGNPDIIAGLDRYNSDKGAVMILFMDSLGKVKGKQQISSGTGGFTYSSTSRFGYSVTKIGDLDGDGVTDVAIGADGENTYAGAVYILFLKKDGTVKSATRIASNTGGFNTTLNSYDLFGVSTRGIGDVNQDGVPDIAVSACGDDNGGTDRGAVYILFLKTDGTVKSYQKISSTEGNFSNQLNNSDAFGVSLASIGDFNRDGIPDIAAGSWGPDEGGTDKGAFWVILLDKNGKAKSYQKISTLSGNFNQTINNSNGFAVALACPGDLDGDGVTDIMVGSNGDDDGGTDRGAFWILYMKADGTVKSSQKISSLTTGLSGNLDNSDHFGISMLNLGDLNKDGAPELAVGAELDDDGNTDAGAFYVIFSRKNFKVVDLALQNFIAPVDTVCQDTAVKITINVKNNGDTLVKSFSLKLNVKGDTSFTIQKSFSTSIDPGKTGSLTFYLPISKGGAYNLSIYNGLSGDVNPYNDSLFKKFVINEIKPDFAFRNTCEGDSVSFTNSTAIKAGTVSSYNWDFGDGQTSKETNPKHQYATKGNYKVTLTAGSVQGCISSIVKNITIYGLPNAAFNFANTCKKDTVFFSNTSGSDSGQTLSASWNFGDGNTSNDFNPKHVYSNAGNYKVRLDITSSTGCINSLEKQIIIYDRPVAGFSYSGTCEYDSILFTNESTGSVSSEQWSFGDGDSSTKYSPSHLYKTAGKYSVTLMLTNSNSCTDAITKEVVIHKQPYVFFKAANECLNTPIRFFDSTHVESGEIIKNMEWSFGDGKTSGGTKPTHTYKSSGNYIVTLTIVSSSGCANTYTDTVTVYDLPSGAYTRSNDTLYAPKGYSKYQWYKNDTIVSGANNNYYVISKAGYYTVLMTNADGCSDSAASKYETPKSSGIEKVTARELTIYPNPGSGLYKISVPENANDATISMSDIAGKSVFRNCTLRKEGKSLLLDAQALPAGVYVLKVKIGDREYVGRIIKM